MTLQQVVTKYLMVSGGYGRPAALTGFGLDRVQTERVFSALDEDYHISRYFHFTAAAGDPYRINGFDHTHLTIDAEIQSLL